MTTKTAKDYLCYCGLNCRMCSIVATLPRLAGNLHQTLQEDGWEFYGSELFPEFPDFWKVLKSISELDQTSPFCRGGCGDPDCGIRKCAIAKDIDVCAFCVEFPCKQLTDFIRRYPFIVQNNHRIREIGIDAWLTEQEELAAKGITNRDLCIQSGM
ncbi:MAG: DUF3795 domain-containing protein [Candidatus Cloacimonadaceae bacterium]|nr:DUF3795 domain-containing protein [Candidatus Cloacimonadaceae bacterium]MDP3114946.1 DUF3795 domain-containing protein [Candidatus Cloacimonadaceae bacterium]